MTQNSMTASHMRAARTLGGAFLFQAVASLGWTLLLGDLVVGDDIISSMTKIASNVTQLRSSIVLAMLTAMGIVVLGVLLRATLESQNRWMASVALGLYLVEAVILATSRVAAFALLRVSQESVLTGHPAHLQSLARLFYEVADFGDWLHMLPFASGALLFYALLLRSRSIPRALAVFGLAAASLALLGTLAVLLGMDIPMAVFYLNLPFELGIGCWLIVKGINEDSRGQ